MLWAGFWTLLAGFWGSPEDSNFEDEGDTRKSSLGPAGDSSPEGFQEASEKIFGLLGVRAAFFGGIHDVS